MKQLMVFADEIENALDKLPKNDSSTLQNNIVSYLFWAVGLVAVIMIVVSGLKMTMSAGDPGAVQKAKQTLIYSVIGLAIAILAYAIVTIVIDRVG